MRTGTKFALVAALAALLACRGQERAPSIAQRPLPDSFPVHRHIILDSALATPGITVQYHWEAPDSAGPALPVSQYHDPWTGAAVTLVDTVAFDLEGAAAARVSPAGAGSMVVLQLSRAGGERLLHTTGWHAGERVGVVVNGYLVTLAMVRTPLSNMLPVVDPIPTDQAQRLADRINVQLQPTTPQGRRP